ncbi:serine hydrolase domain-containing protein [Vagococcus salmoninarum]|uniref:serine hydrolase domain-containing protein n=1 Tax=Vagococcus salmoninarum TaxID=2739 RepID=UPI0028D47B02|nr:serine hydrolase domain-containing protein [Vagococcus salmoninarum]
MYYNTELTIKKQLSENVFPGAVFAFVKKGETYQQALGSAALLPTQRPMTKETLFDVASLTKMIGTNTLILKLLEAGQLKLDDPLKKHLPEFADSLVTIRHLLTHTSDINPYIKNRDQLTAEPLKEALLALTSGELIGNKCLYTDTGTLLLGFLIEKLTGQPVQTVITNEVLGPLGMTSSGFTPTCSDIAATEDHPLRGVICGTVHDPKAFVLGEKCGSSGLFSTLDDCLLFCQMMLAGGTTATGQRLLQAQTIDQLFADHSPNQSFNRSLGWDLKYDLASQEAILFHTGYTGTFLLIDKKAQEAFVFLSNRLHPEDNRQAYLLKRQELLDIYLQEKAQLS